jgi:2-C-methyl-D-erythritol 4-phosphate cytidylyltransferase
VRGPRVVAVIVAAGRGDRLNGDQPKAFLPVAGRRMVEWSIDAVRGCRRVDHVIVVVPRGRLEWAMAALGRSAPLVQAVEGGDSRAISVARGVGEAPASADILLVHDAARPLVSTGLVEKVLAGVGGWADGAIAAHPVADTLKIESGERRIGRTMPRAGLWAAETPQAFRADRFRDAIARGIAEGALDQLTDCAGFMEAQGRPVRLVPSSMNNLKITTPPDLELAEALLDARTGAGRVD